MSWLFKLLLSEQTAFYTILNFVGPFIWIFVFVNSGRKKQWKDIYLIESTLFRIKPEAHFWVKVWFGFDLV